MTWGNGEKIKTLFSVPTEAIEKNFFHVCYKWVVGGNIKNIYHNCLVVGDIHIIKTHLLKLIKV